MNTLLVTHSGRGKELREMLQKELGIPESARSFEVRFAVGESVTVRCEYFATAAAFAPQESFSGE